MRKIQGHGPTTEGPKYFGLTPRKQLPAVQILYNRCSMATNSHVYLGYLSLRAQLEGGPEERPEHEATNTD